MYGPEYPVDGPAPAAGPYNLIRTAQVVNEAADPDRWINGVSVQPYPSDCAGTHDPCATGSAITTKAAGTLPTFPTFGSFTAYLPVKCSSFGWDGGNYEERATAALDAVAPAAVENEFWSGTRVPGNIFLTKAGGTFVTAATNLLNGLALLERAIANTCRMGMIHAPPEIATGWASLVLIEPDRAGIMRTVAMGTPVVVGLGYPGTPQAGATPNGTTELVAYATGPVQVRQTNTFLVPPTLGEALDRSQNTVTVRAERHYNISYDGVLRYGIRIDRCKTTC
jgi:hypothetical protein